MVVKSNDEMIIRINLNEPKIVETETIVNKVKKKKNLSFDSLARILMDSTEDNFEFDSMLPQNMCKIKIQKGVMDVYVVVHPKQLPVRYALSNNQGIVLLPYPKLLFCFSFGTEAINFIDGRCFAIKDEKISQDTELYHFPYSNVSDVGDICFGSNKIKTTGDISKDVNNLIELFFASPYNDDYYKVNRTGYLVNSFKELLNLLDNQKSFPCEKLVSTGQTLSDI